MKNLYIKFIAERLEIKEWQVENCAGLFEEGNTIPFISRYRKEKTGGLDDVEVAEIKHWTDVFEEIEKRKSSILATINDQGKLTEELKASIENCVISSELEDLYLPYRPKRRTKATVAKEAGLEPLADKMLGVAISDPYKEALKYINEKVATVDDAISGANDIIAEKLSETASIRETLRRIFRTRRIVSKASKAAADSQEALKYKGYFDYSEPLSRIASHRLLAILRGQSEGFLTVKIDADAEKCGNKLYYDICQATKYPSPALGKLLRAAVDDAYSRLLSPSITNEILKEAKEKADVESINVFGENLKQLLLAPPVGQKRTMAIDPGFRNGCKIACLDEQGDLLCHDIIYPHPPQNDKVKSIMSVAKMVQKYDIQAIAIGNGTASRETEEFIKRIDLPEECRVFIVSEDGASIYSASEVARKEFPDEDVTVRGAVSIGRRLMDPLAELVKIDPKSLGIGQYQYDVDQSLLKEKLDNIVVMCVNTVGVNLNTASEYLLQYVSGIGPALAASIVEYRSASGGFESRSQLLKVPRLGAKAFEQCAGFIRIPKGLNPLENTAVHPESYKQTEELLKSINYKKEDLLDKAKLAKINEELSKIDIKTKAQELNIGELTLTDIINELKKPGRDPRDDMPKPVLRSDVLSFDDLKEGQLLTGTVRNITDFGAFVDIGVKHDGLVHLSELSDKFIKTPSEVVAIGDVVQVKVIEIDREKQKVKLSMKNI